MGMLVVWNMIFMTFHSVGNNTNVYWDNRNGGNTYSHGILFVGA